MQNHKTTPTSPPSPGDKYERTDASATYITIMAIATLLMVVVALPVITGTNMLLEKLSPAPPALSPLATNPTPPEPRLQANEKIDYLTLLASQQATMNEYRWIDKQEGVLRIPVERAMSLLLDPTRPKPKPESPKDASPSSEGTPSGAGDKTPS